MPKILVVDDSRTVNKLLSDGLAKTGYEVTSCFDVDSAIEALEDKTSSIGLVITDLIMPGKDGNDLIDFIHAHAAKVGTRPKIVAISGGSAGTVTADTAVMSIQHRVEKILKKPFKPETLMAVVREQIG